MNFVERWLGVSPDAGSGLFEVCTILAVLIVISVFVFRGKILTTWYQCIGNVAWPE
jgi:hypothetical protein